MDGHNTTENHYPDIEARLRPLAEPLDKPEAGDWRAAHKEKQQSFRQYLSALPVCRNTTRSIIYLSEVGELDESQQRIVQMTREYLHLFFDSPVVCRPRIPLADVPSHARRRHPEWGTKQIRTTFVLQEILEPTLPENALASLAVTARDLWPGEDWNFVFGEAELRNRVGIWSIHRLGWPGKNEAAFRTVLRRSLSLATHETGHILTMMHCIKHRCFMNGCNNLTELDRSPLTPCLECLRKLLWNLQAEPIPYFQRLQSFLATHGMEEAKWYAEALETLERC